MKLIKMLSVFILSIILCTCVIFSANCSTSTNDEYELSKEQNNLVPLYTVAENSDLKENNNSLETPLFYTQTTALALLAGYLILFKIKGINTNKEKMHKKK